MKVLKENKEKLPISFLTQFVSEGWQQVGYLKEQIKGIDQTFSGTKDIQKIMQDLADAYLVCLGQVEALLEDKNYIQVEKQPEKEINEQLKSEELSLLKEDLIENEPQAAELEQPSQQKQNDFVPFEYFCDFE